MTDLITILQGGSAAAVQEFVNSPEFEPIGQKIEDRARKAVVDETKQNVVSLVAVAVAAGAIGGAIMPRGIIGAILGGAIGWWAVQRLMAPKQEMQQTQQLKGIGSVRFSVPSRRQLEYGDVSVGWQKAR